VRSNDRLDIGRRPVNRAEPVVDDRPLEIGDEVGIGVDHDQLAVTAQAIEHRAAERADAGAIFDKDRQLSQSTRDRTRRIVRAEEGTTAPTITGCFTNPFKNNPVGPIRRRALRMKRAGNGSWASSVDDIGDGYLCSLCFKVMTGCKTA
jgi:hypothetical protein